MQIVLSLYRFFWNNFPPAELIAWLLPLTLLWSFAALYLAAYLKRDKGWKTGYTRKVFHFIIFFSAILIQSLYQLQGVFILGWAVSAVVFLACLKGNGHWWYEALAREKDAPFRTQYILISYLATFAGGVCANMWFGTFAVLGYAVTGISDAVAEPVGTRWGRHTYRVLSGGKRTPAYKSLEGSAAFFISAVLILLLISSSTTAFELSFPIVLIVAFICTVTEAYAPPGTDNFLLQLAAGGCAMWLATL